VVRRQLTEPQKIIEPEPEKEDPKVLEQDIPIEKPNESIPIIEPKKDPTPDKIEPIVDIPIESDPKPIEEKIQSKESKKKPELKPIEPINVEDLHVVLAKLPDNMKILTDIAENPFIERKETIIKPNVKSIEKVRFPNPTPQESLLEKYKKKLEEEELRKKREEEERIRKELEEKEKNEKMK